MSGSAAGRYWVNGGLVEPAAATVSVLDHGLTVGDGVFETLLVRGGVPFAVTRHLQRLARSAAGLGIDPPAEDVVREAVLAVVADGGGAARERGRLRITITSGVGPVGSGRGSSAPTLVVTLTPASAWGAATTLATVPWTRNERSAIAGLKTTSYAENAIALAHAQAHGAEEAVLANTVGDLCEGTGTNVFVVLDGVVRTPPLGSGCLAGVTRDLVLEWCAAAGVAAREERLPYDVLGRATEVFVTSSTRDVMPVSRIDRRTLPTGPVTRRVAELFAARAGVDQDP